jgi:enoyl-CoA hydratase/carnithine racemase
MGDDMSIRIDRGDVWTVTLDRPERANALSADLVDALHRAFDAAEEARPEALVLRGNPRHFAAGFDLGGLDEQTDASLALRFLRIGLLLERVIAAPFVTVAVAEGAAVGAGADLVLACDHRLVGTAVTLRFPGSAFGVALGGVRRAELGADLVTGQPDDLPQVLRAAPPPRPSHDADADLAALARSVAVPGLRDRLAAYAAPVLNKEHA